MSACVRAFVGVPFPKYGAALPRAGQDDAGVEGGVGYLAHRGGQDSSNVSTTSSYVTCI